MIIDFRVRPPFKSLCNPNIYGPTIRIPIRSLPRGSGPDSDVARLFDMYPGRFVGFGSVDGSSDDAVGQVDQCVDLGFKGVAMGNGWCVPALYDDESLFPVYERVAEHGLIPKR